MAKVCIPKEYIDRVRNILTTTGDNSLNRLNAFKEFYGGDLAKAQELNLMFEKNLLLKKQENIVQKFIAKVTGLTDQQRIEAQAKISAELARKSEILNKEELLSIVKNVIDKKYKVDITPEQASSIAKIKAETNALKEVGLKTPEGSPERLAWGRREVDLKDIMEDIANPNSKLGFLNTIKQIAKDDAQRIANQTSILGKAGEVTSMGVDLITSPVYKSLKAAADASFALRQGFKVLTKNPSAWWKINKEAFSVLLNSKEGSQKLYREFQANLMTSDLYQKAINSGLALGKVEDFFPVPIGEKIPFLGGAFKNSNSAFSVFSEGARMSLFENMYKNQVKILGGEPSEEVTKGLAMLANSITGRGSFGKYENIANIANKVFFSGRYVKSAIDTFTLPFDPKLPEAVRKEALKSSVATLSSIAGLMSTVALFTDVEFDPRSSKFGKARIPGTERWIDMTAGLGSYITLATRIALGLSTDVAEVTDIKPYVSSSGKESNLNTGKFGGATIASVIGNWASNKLAPAPSVLLQTLKGKDYSGEKPTLAGSALNLVAPISPENIYDSAVNSEDSASTQVISALFDLLGASVTDYNKFK